MGKQKPPKAPVVPISTRELDDPPPRSRRVVRWLVPSATFPAYAHAAVVAPDVALATMCKAHHVEGAIYPPAPGVPRCADCVRLVKLEEAANG